ncbi:Uncharacterised protein [Slackia heliotrinireducens]|uniref:Uncharacterized protein n=1 Tax=Slackia heliotrinireducens (strain ATCC 29202 / DSM 20476 / NCTC 11029 / RHS 1) TaxID=471855 RepID=C7N291_SLAHD|nr:hypothetical protein [Slackia heliotrinireducens]ACV21397.1 hypothetical protein Shel_03300 [Slackia heliotrinireducens DSM 20476]VEG98830.1 Uncharacterised protein [Slackia heliotrinireducens]
MIVDETKTCSDINACLDSSVVAMRVAGKDEAHGIVRAGGRLFSVSFSIGKQPQLIVHPPACVATGARRSFVLGCAERCSKDPAWFGMWMDPKDGELVYNVRLSDVSTDSFDRAAKAAIEFLGKNWDEIIGLATAPAASDPEDDEVALLSTLF